MRYLNILRSSVLPCALARIGTFSGVPTRGAFLLRGRSVWQRNKSTTTRVSFEELGASFTNGSIEPLEPLEAPLGVGKRSKKNSMYQNIRKIIAEHPSSVVITQVGGFFELYFEQAAEFGPKLNLKVAKKSTQEDDSGFVFMSGFPCYQLDRYLKMLVNDLGKTVTLVEQFELPPTPSESKSNTLTTTKNIERRITRTITPGTLISETFIDAHQGNYLLAIAFTNAHLEKVPMEDSPVGLSWIDLSVGTFCYQTSTVKDLSSDIARLRPREILLDSEIKKFSIETGKWYSELTDLSRYFLTYQRFPPRDAFGSFSSAFVDASVSAAQYSADNLGNKEVTAIMAILTYLKESLPEHNLELRFPVKVESSEVMKMDSRSIDSLELFQTAGDFTRGSLFNTIKRTVSPSGTRLLSRWLSEPLVDINQVTHRHSLVEYFLSFRELKREIHSELAAVNDCMRLLQKVHLRSKVDPTDLVAIADTVFTIEIILKYLIKNKTEDGVLNDMITRLQENIGAPLKLAKKIYKWLDVDSVMSQTTTTAFDSGNDSDKENGTSSGVKPKKLSNGPSGVNGMVDNPIIKESASAELERVYNEYRSFGERKEELQRGFNNQQPPGVQVVLKWSPQFLYHVHVSLSGTKKNGVFDNVNIPGTILNQTKSRQCIQNSEWAALGSSRESILERRKDIEEKLLQKLRKKAMNNRNALRECCDVLDELDVIISFSTLAAECGLIKPEMTEKEETTIVEGRHTTVETGLNLRGLNFVPNDCYLNSGDQHNKIWVITGPNMGGKSTFIRQTAITTILAQIGSYVPAKHATIGIVDKIFCRIGAADDLYRDRSTFMVEMLETSSILRNATSRSLAILDEVGRGTSGKDGLALAYATVSHLSNVNRCRALFATHFGRELHGLLKKKEMSGLLDYYHTDVIETEGSGVTTSFLFDYKLKQGICVDSQGIKVAAMAGFPERALEIAENAMTFLDEN